MSSFLIRNPVGILTGEMGGAARASGDIRVAGGVIREIGELTPNPGERQVDASNCVVTPGLVNTHHHLFQSVLKSIPEGLNEALATWLRLVPYSYWDRLDEAALRVSATIGLVELALSGVTSVADHHYLYSDRYDFDPDEILFETAGKFGLRFVLARGGATKSRKFDSDSITPIPTETLDEYLSAVETAVRRWHDPAADAKRRVVAAPTNGAFSMEESELIEVLQAARALGVRLHSHLSENHDYVDFTMANFQKRPVHWLGDLGWLGEDIWFAHLVECDDSEIERLAETGTAMAHSPQANCRLGSGIASADKLSARGGTVSLGVDGAAANEAADMMTSMFLAFSLHRARHGVEAVAPETILHWATAGGAKTLGLETMGVIKPGMSADLALFDLDHPRYFGQHDRVAAPIISGGQGNIRHSFVAGEPVVSNGILPWLDMEQLAADAAAIVDRLRMN